MKHTHNKKNHEGYRLIDSFCSGLCEKGFSLIELMIVVAILISVGAIVIPSIASFQEAPQLNNAFEEVISILRIAQNRTLSSEANSKYGVYFDTATTPHQYVLFKGASFSSRDVSYDLTYPLLPAVEFYEIDTGDDDEIVFDRLTGFTANSGSISVRLKNDTNKTKTVYIDGSGVISPIAPSVYSDSSRIKDSRHVDFDYSRVINTATEDMTLTFNGNVLQTIPINQYVGSGQFDWEGTFNIAGTDQTLRIHTLRLNSPDTRFSVFRDKRLSDKSLVIELSGDVTGTLAEYSADGLTTNFHSIYVNNFAWQ